MIERLPDDYTFLEKYDCVCCECGHDFFICPSLLMLGGINSGSGSCSKCKAFLRFKIDVKNQIAISSLF
jgi:hypothetical protein